MNQNIHSKRAPNPVGLYPHAKRAGDLLFLSGVGPREAGTNNIPEGIAAQCHSVFKNVRTILEDSGQQWSDLVDVTVFLTNMKTDFKIYNDIYAEYFGEVKPCRTTVEVTSLPTPISIELKCIAYVGGKK